MSLIPESFGNALTGRSDQFHWINQFAKGSNPLVTFQNFKMIRPSFIIRSASDDEYLPLATSYLSKVTPFYWLWRFVGESYHNLVNSEKQSIPKGSAADGSRNP